MAKKIKFPLKLNSADCRTLNEVRENWNINEVYVYFVDGRLLTWCKDRHYIQADKIAEISIEDSNARKKLCEIFDVEYVAGDSDSDDWRPKTPEEVEKYNRLTNYTADKEILKKFRQVAFDRDELDDLIDDYGEIYLCNNTFEEFPINVENKKYIGIGKVTVKIPNKEIVDFYEKNITFKNINVNDVDDVDDSPTPLPENPAKSQVEEWFDSAEKAFKEKNYQIAFEFYQKAADLGDANAMNGLAVCYHFGKGTSQDIHKAFELYGKAADLGNIDAMMELAYNYRNGGILSNIADKSKALAKALELYQKAAELGNTDAMFHAGMIYLKSEGTQQVVYKGINWLAKAAELRNVRAIKTLSNIYLNGDFGIEKNNSLAYKYYCQGANEGDADSMYGLGVMYHEGLGVNKDKKMAIAWLKQAAAKGHTAAKELLKKIKDCFITAAVCESFNKPDDCFELTTFRNFRDNWLALQSDGKNLIEEYYKMAPQIVANINKLTNANEIYKKLWYDWLKPCLEFIKVGDNVACKNKYVEMVQNLKKLYL